jgi:sec-independent protein translocase protein TatA
MGMGEWILVLVIVVLFFGARRLPGLGAALGKALRNVRGSVRTEPPAKPPGGSAPRSLPGPRDGGGA